MTTPTFKNSNAEAKLEKLIREGIITTTVGKDAPTPKQACDRASVSRSVARWFKRVVLLLSRIFLSRFFLSRFFSIAFSYRVFSYRVFSYRVFFNRDFKPGF